MWATSLITEQITKIWNIVCDIISIVQTGIWTRPDDARNTRFYAAGCSCTRQ